METHLLRYERQEQKRRLEAVGFEPPQAEELVDMVRDREQEVATKQDVVAARSELKSDVAELTVMLTRLSARVEGQERAMDELRQEMRGGADAFRQEMRGAMGALRQEMNDRFESFRQEIAGQMEGLRGELRAVKWLFGAMLALMVPMLGGIVGLALR